MLDSIYHRTLKLLKSHFWRDSYVNILPSFAQGYYRRHNVTLLIFIDFIAWRYITPRRGLIVTLIACIANG